MSKDTFSQRTIVLTKVVDGNEIKKILDVNVASTLPMVVVNDKILESTKIRSQTSTLSPEEKLITLSALNPQVGDPERFILMGNCFDVKHNAVNYLVYDSVFEDILFIPDYTTIIFKSFNKVPSYPVTGYRLGSGKNMPHIVTSYLTKVPDSKKDEEYVPISKTNADITLESFLVDMYGLEYSQEDQRGNNYYEIPRNLNSEVTNFGVMNFKSQDLTMICLGTIGDFLEDDTNNGEGLPLYNVYKTEKNTYGLRFMDRNCMLDLDTKVYFYVQF